MATLTAQDVLSRISHRLPQRPEKPRVRLSLAFVQAHSRDTSLAATLPPQPAARPVQPKEHRTKHQPRMTAEQALSFDRFSLQNAVAIRSALSCDCEPYEDVFTFNRWLAQGFAVQKGQKAVRITTWVDTRPTDRDDDGDDAPSKTRPPKRPHTSFVFCRHQVGPVQKGARS